MFSFHSSIFNKVNKTDSSINSIDFSKFDKIIFDSNSVLNTKENLSISKLLDEDNHSAWEEAKNNFLDYEKRKKQFLY